MTPGRWRLALVGLGLLAVALHFGAINNQLTFDDHWAIERNPTVAQPWAFGFHFSSGFWGPGWEEHDAAWRPATTLTLAWNYAAHGLAPAGYFLINLLLHALAAVFVAMLARALGLARGWAFAAGALFAVHPVHVEAIAAGVGRADLLMGAAGLGAVVAWEHRRWAVALVALAVAMFAKEMGAMVALVIAWRELTRDGVRWQRPASWRWAWPLAVLAAWLVCRYAVLGTLGNAHPGYLENPLAFEGTGVRLVTAGDVYRRSLQLFVAPVTLVADYSYATVPPVHGVSAGAVVGWLLLAGTIAATVVAARRAPAVGAALALWIGPYLLVSHLGPTLPMIFAERVLYLPSAGLCVLVAFGAARLAADRRTVEHALAAVLAVAAAALAWRSHARVADWADDATLFVATAADAPRGVKPLCNAARIELERGDHETALALTRRALEIRPQSALPHLTLAEIHIAAGEPAAAAEELRAALERKPDNSRYQAVTCAFFARFRPAEAVPVCERAAEDELARVDVWMFLAMAYDQNGRTADADRAFQIALSKTGNNQALTANYARFLARNGRLDQAEQLAEALVGQYPERADYAGLLQQIRRDRARMSPR